MANYFDNPRFGQGVANIFGSQGVLGNQDLALALLANSGWSPNKRGFGEILGTSMMQAQQMGQQRQTDALREKYMEAQIKTMGNRAGSGIYGAVQPDKFTPESLAKFEQTGRYSDLQIRPVGTLYGRYNPGDYTPASWAAFRETGDESVLERYVAPQNASVERIGGGISVVQPDRRGGPARITQISTPDAEVDAAARLEREKAASAALGEAQGAQGGKAPAKASLDYVIRQFEPMIAKTMQGGLFGVKGRAGTVLDKADKERFNNLREQLSTELRTVFRIPGEGTLSDREQAQYGIQLPHVDNEPETNIAILKDIDERTRLRTETPIPGATPAPSAIPPAAPTRRKYNPATGRIE